MISFLIEDPSDDEIVTIFMDFCDKLQEVQKTIKSNKKLTNKDEEALDKVIKEGRSIKADYYGNVQSEKNRSSSDTKSRQVTETINRMRKHINKSAMDMNKLFRKLNIETVSTCL